MVKTVVYMVHDIAKMAQRNLATKLIWEPNTIILKITVAYVGKVILAITKEISITYFNKYNLINFWKLL